MRMVCFVYQDKNIKTKDSTTGMIAHDASDTQAIIQDAMKAVPAILHGGANKKLYILASRLDEELEEFILTGKARSANGEYHTMPAEEEARLAREWRRLGLSVTYHSQQVEHMHRKARVIYLQVEEPDGEMKVSVIPWFMLPGRPFTVMAYAYAIWHYHETGEKSQRESAAAAGKVFGVSKMNKSTVSRNMKGMEELLGAPAGGGSPPCGVCGATTAEDIIGAIPEILRKGVAGDALAETFGVHAKRLPAHNGRGEERPAASDAIPHEYANVIRARGGGGQKHADGRKRPARPRKKRHAQRAPTYVGHAEIERVRIGFTEACRRLVLEAAAKRHRFLL